MNKNVLLLPVCDGGVTKTYKKSNHLGVDFGWLKKEYCEVLAVQDGKVVDNFYSSSCGHSIVIRHDYSDGTHRFTGYIHLAKQSALKVGAEVKQGQTIGLRGNTGKSNGTHLHIYVTETTTEEYSWETLKKLCTFDPFPLFFKSRKYSYTLATSDKYLVNNLAFMEDIPTDEVEKLQQTIKEQQEQITNLQTQLETATKTLNDCESKINNIKNLLK